MPHSTSDIAFTPSVKAVQVRFGSRANYARMEQGVGWVERAIRFHVKAWDVNCRQHIAQRFTKPELEPIVQPLRERVAELEAELQALRATVSQQRPNPLC